MVTWVSLPLRRAARAAPALADARQVPAGTDPTPDARADAGLTTSTPAR
jgi:hypothetical protein